MTNNTLSREPEDVLNERNAHPNPMYDYFTGFVPRKLKDMFRWTEYLYYKSPHIFASLQKLSEYIITDVNYTTDRKEIRDKFEEAMEEDLNIDSFLKTCARDRYLYGNGFISVYFPFKRMVPINNGNDEIALSNIDYEYDSDDLTFTFDDPETGKQNVVHLDDIEKRDVRNTERINLIRWDPKHINIDHNPVSGECIYYYDFPSSFKQKIEEGNQDVIDQVPASFLKAIADENTIRFKKDKIYHLKIPAPAGVDHAWGFPPLTATLGQFFYTQMLRKANEAIAMDHMVPFRVLHPEATSRNGDPIESISLGMWVDKMQDNLKQWRQDPLHIMFAPVALGVTQMGGQGRSLLTLGEIKEAETNILAGMGIPREFLFGGLSYTGSSVTLRMLENQLKAHSNQIEGLLQWIADKLAEYMGWPEINTDITPFKLVDDVQQKGMLLQADQKFNFLSQHTAANMFDLDLDEELEQRKEEQIEQAQRRQEIQKKIKEQQESLSEQAKRMSGPSTGLNYDQQVMINKADQMVKQLQQLDYGERKSMLSQLEEEDFVMYSVVVKRLEQMQQVEERQASQAADKGGR